MSGGGGGASITASSVSPAVSAACVAASEAAAAIPYESLAIGVPHSAAPKTATSRIKVDFIFVHSFPVGSLYAIIPVRCEACSFFAPFS
jgi:hypothetical protein